MPIWKQNWRPFPITLNGFQTTRALVWTFLCHRFDLKLNLADMFGESFLLFLQYKKEQLQGKKKLIMKNVSTGSQIDDKIVFSSEMQPMNRMTKSHLRQRECVNSSLQHVRLSKCWLHWLNVGYYPDLSNLFAKIWRYFCV